MKQKTIDIIVALAAIVVGLTFYFGAAEFSGAARIFPQVFGIALSVLGLALLGISWILPMHKEKKAEGKRTPQEVQSAEKKQINWRIPAFVVLMVLYYFAFKWIGYLVPTLILVFFTSYILGYKKHWMNALFSVLLTTGLYVVFTFVFKVRL